MKVNEPQRRRERGENKEGFSYHKTCLHVFNDVQRLTRADRTKCKDKAKKRYCSASVT
ncbi:hypothetical protein [Nostoc punctiforme]|jgi:hypothetical protein|uniref:hypothetical protein n=1 Tax=Nostoc punctiforme TaxID=272131 RepID=UPI001427E844|nr:hypothetical protein [Nostoc punctiforme]